MKKASKLLPLVLVASATWTTLAAADEPRFHATAGAAHAVGGDQQSEFGFGGGGSAAIELPVGRVLGFQATAGGVVLSEGDAPSDPSLAPKGTGTAFLGTVGVRVHPLGLSRVDGLWASAGGGLAQTGANGRVALDLNVGWDFRVSKDSRWDVGPFVGYTHILQSNNTLRTDDGRIAWAGIQISLGARDPKMPSSRSEMGAVELPLRDRDGVAAVEDMCPPPSELDGSAPEGCPSQDVKIVGDRIVLGDIIHFDFDSPRIKSQSVGLVRRVAYFIVTHPEILEVSVEGHADAQGTADYNQKLSEARAASTRQMIVRFGVEESRIRVVGHGKTHLKVATNLAEPRNRRVEFVITRDAQAFTPPRPPAPSPRVASGTRGQP